MLLLTNRLDAQARGTTPVNPTMPPNSTKGPVVTPNFHLPPWDGAVAAPLGKEAAKENALEQLRRQPRPNRFLVWLYEFELRLEEWHPTLYTLYEFSNERSRIGGLSFDINSAFVDLGARYRDPPYTALDLRYIYSHVNGWSPFGSSEVENQHIGFLQVVQPLNSFWDPNRSDPARRWKPADLGFNENVNNQLAIIIGGGYGGSPVSLSTPNSPINHNTSHIFLGEALLDYQLTWFPCPEHPTGTARTQYYPSLLFEASSGIEYDTAQPDSSTPVAGSTYARQLYYANIATLTYSFPCRFGLQVGIEWDAPISREATLNSQPVRANTFTFSGGLVYNFYRSKSANDTSAKKVSDSSAAFWEGFRDHCSASVLYSYTAFDPLIETNTVQIQFSYLF